MQIAFYATTRTYTKILELHDRAHIVPDLRAALEKKDHDKMIELIDDEFCDELTAAGPAEECKQKIAAMGKGVLDRLIVAGPWYGPNPERMFENYQALVETFGKKS